MRVKLAEFIVFGIVMALLTRLSIWLWVPALVASFAFWPHLGAAYQPDVFWQDIPAWLGFTENAARIGVISLSALLVFERGSRNQTFGWACYILGLAAYVGCQVAIVMAPTSLWATSIFGFLAPAYTPAIWIFSIALTAERSVLLQFYFVRVWFACLASIFLVAHIAHASIVFTRLT